MKPLGSTLRKYRNTPTRLDGQSWRSKADGQRFDSIAEWKRWRELQLLVKAKQITDLRRQPRYSLIVNGDMVCTYVGDFYYRTAFKPTEDGMLQVVEDVKGMETAVFKIKAKLFRALYPSIELRVVPA